MSEMSSGNCQYACYQGTWRLIYNEPASGFYCPTSVPGVCSGGTTYSPPVPRGGSLRMVQAKPVPKNGGEYMYERGAKSVYLLRGSCKRGMFMPPEVKLKDLATIAPSVFNAIEAIRKDKSILQMKVVIPAQPIEPTETV